MLTIEIQFICDSQPIRTILGVYFEKKRTKTVLCIYFNPIFYNLWNGSEEKTLTQALETTEELTSIQPAGQELTEEFESLISQVREGLKIHSPEPISEGVNGSYFLKDRDGNHIAVFKPEDEEGNSPNNPKKSDSISPLQDIRLGEGAIKEVAAYLLDDTGFYSVPKTILVDIRHPIFLTNGKSVKRGSLQQYVENDGSSWDIGSSVFPTREVHKIGILDLQIMNLDRHGGNILFRETENGSYNLIPIDNGFSFPDDLNKKNIWFEWMNWKAAKKPFDEETLQYILNIDLERNVEMLKEKLHLRSECLKMFKLGTTLLKKGASKGLTLFEIGSMVCSTCPNQPCKLKTLIDQANTIAPNEDNFNILSDLIEEEMDKMNYSK